MSAFPVAMPSIRSAACMQFRHSLQVALGVMLASGFLALSATTATPPVASGGESLPQVRTSSSSAPHRLTFGVHYNPPTCPVTVSAWPAGAQAAFAYATQVWSERLAGSQTIEIDACWVAGLLASTGARNRTAFVRGFPGAPVADTWYPVALANQLAGSDRDAGAADMCITINADTPWYFGLDGKTPAHQLDLVTAVLHEIGHGLGLSSALQWDDGQGSAECSGSAGQGCWGWSDERQSPTIYDRFVTSGAREPQYLIGSFENGSLALGKQLVGGDLVFAGPHAAAANGGTPPQLWAPSNWTANSVTHLDMWAFLGTPSSLMNPLLSLGTSAHHPGPIVLGMLADMGWEILPAQ